MQNEEYGQQHISNHQNTDISAYYIMQTYSMCQHYVTIFLHQAKRLSALIIFCMHGGLHYLKST
jgi:hypothetical protein